MIYNSNSPWLDRSLKLPPIFEPLLSSIATDIAGGTGKRRRKDGIDNIKAALSVIAANLLQLHALCPSCGLRIDLSNDGYRKGPFNPNRLGCRAVQKVVGYLANSDPPLINRKGGNFDRKRGRGYPTEIWITDTFKKDILEYRSDILEKSACVTISGNNCKSTYNQPITRNIFSIQEYIEYHGLLFDKDTLPSIRLREGSSKNGSPFIDFEHSPKIQTMMERVNRYNSFVGRRVVNLFVSDKDIENITDSRFRNVDEFGEFKSESGPVDMVLATSLYRVFNDGKFDHGGRFYGGWWQNVPKEYRRLITIDGLPTVEVDFSSMQLAMLYAKVDRQLEGDAYAIEGIGREFRPLIKTATLKLINADGRIRSPRRSALPKDVSWKDLQQAILKRHEPIAKFFGSGEGIRLQRLDSDIAEDVILRMMEKGILALPIHDSFIVAADCADVLSDTMIDAYQQRMGGYAIAIKQSQSLLDELLAGRDGLKAEERYATGLELFKAKKERPEYGGYRQREKLLGRERCPEENNKVGLAHQVENRLNDEIAETGPRTEVANPGMMGALRELTRLWDRLMGKRKAS